MSKNKRYTRKPGKRTKKKALRIYVEGTTEYEYFDRVRCEMHIPRDLIRVVNPRQSNSLGIVERAISDKEKQGWQEEQVDQWWAVFDSEIDRSGLNEAIDLGLKNGINIAISDISIEYWLLLHFERTTMQFNSVQHLIRYLRQYLQDYNENNKHPDMNLLIPKLALAVENADWVREHHTKLGNISPRTDCDLLVRSINEQAESEYQILSSSPVDLSQMFTSFSK